MIITNLSLYHPWKKKIQYFLQTFEKCYFHVLDQDYCSLGKRNGNLKSACSRATVSPGDTYRALQILFHKMCKFSSECRYEYTLGIIYWMKLYTHYMSFELHLFKRGPVNSLHKRMHLHISSFHKFNFSYKVENIVPIWNKWTIVSFFKKPNIYPFILFFFILVDFLF